MYLTEIEPDELKRVNSYHPISILPKVNVLFYKKQNNT